MEEALIKSFLAKYENSDYTFREIMNVHQKYRGLSCRMGSFTMNNRTKKDLFNLDGTIPVNYKGAVYNIPICIWIMDNYPQTPPVSFVKPTPDMSLKVSKYVDNTGKIYLPYLHKWKAFKSTLLNLIQCMITAFSEIPPVFSKPHTSEIPGPPYPVFNAPYPQIPAQGGYPAPTSWPSYNTPYPQPSNSNMPFIDPNSPSPPVQGYRNQDNAGTITEEHIKASLLSAVCDKLRRRLNEQSQQTFAELETLRRTQQELRDGKVRLEDIISRLQQERLELDKNVSILQEKEKELQTAVDRLADQKGIDVDEAVVTTAPLYSQLLNSFAEEATLEDAIYYMGEALRKEVITLETFLKQVRMLARKQFTLRALMQKCRQKAQLAC